MAVAFGPKAVIVFATARVMLHADARPVVKRISQSNVAAITHQHRYSFSALSRNRRDASVGSKPMVVAFGE